MPEANKTKERKSKKGTSFSRFQIVIREIGVLSKTAIGAGIAVPAIAHTVGLSPPNEPSVGILTGFVQVVACAVAFHYFSKKGRRTVNRALRFWSTIAGAGMLTYLALRQLLIVAYGSKQYVRGLVCTPEAKMLPHYDRCPFFTDSDIADVVQEIHKLWTPESMAISSYSLLILWLASVACLAVTMTIFVCYHMETPEK